MKALTILAAIALTSSSAMALDTVMGLKGRFDYVRTETENTPGSKDSNGILTTSFLRLVTEAKFNETTKAKLTLDFTDSGTAADNALSNFVDEAFITKTLGDFSVMVGKQAVMVGGRENDYSSRDVYTLTKFNSAVSDSVTGVSAGYTMAGQNVYLQYLQQTAAQQGATATFTDKKIIGLAYYGSFMSEMIQPILSYHKQGTSRQGQYDVYTAAGVRVNVATFTVEADYLMLNKEKAGQNSLTAAANSDDAELTSMVVAVRYNHENFKPFAKYISDKGEGKYDGIISTNGAIETERTAWELGLEYVPNKDEDMRYHVVYSNSEAKETTGTTKAKTEDQKIYAGLAFNYNILK